MPPYNPNIKQVAAIYTIKSALATPTHSALQYSKQVLETPSLPITSPSTISHYPRSTGH